jgi:ubiquinone/menaquinone biosynthesis C-methylase UbiE
MTKELEENYTMGRSDGETQRLVKQAQLYEAVTERLIERAGIKEGMRVLDLGSGAGSVAIALANKVGTSGEVVGVDMNGDILESARKHAEDVGFNNVSFIQGDLRNVELQGEFDAIYGRLVMMYVPEPTDAVKHLTSYLKPGGIVAFQEVDFTFYRSFNDPKLPLINKLANWFVDAFEVTGANIKMGIDISQILIEAGLNHPQLDFTAPMGVDENWPGYQYVEDTFKSLLPLLEKHNIVTNETLDVDTLAQRVRDEVVNSKRPLVLTPHVSAWTTKPEQE